jgi:peptidoglycan/LPS O-acetylase OafA/YrhL
MQRLQSARIPQLDGIRGIAITLVMIWHYGFGYWIGLADFPKRGSTGSMFLHIFNFAWSGVDLFFVLSGFLIGGILLDNLEAENYFQTFYVRRAFRILPLYFVVIAIGSALYFAGIHDSSNVPPIVWYLVIAQNIWMAVHDQWNIWLGQAWSLGVEEQFYLLLPLLLWITPRPSIRSACLLFIGSAVILRWAMVWHGAGHTVAMHVLFPARMDTLFTGVLCADLYRDERAKAWMLENRTTLYGILGALAVPLAVMVLFNWRSGTIPMALFGYNLLAAFYGCFLLIAVTETKGPILRLTTLAPLRTMGRLAYFIFLTHCDIPVYVFKVIDRSFDPASVTDWSILALSALLVIGLAELSWRYFEKPLMLWGHRIAQYRTVRSEQPAVPEPATS